MEFGLIYGRQTARWPQQRQHDLANIKHDVALYWPNRYAMREGDEKGGGEPSNDSAVKSFKKAPPWGFYQPFIEGQCVHAKMPAGRLALCGLIPPLSHPSLSLSLSLAFSVCALKIKSNSARKQKHSRAETIKQMIGKQRRQIQANICRGRLTSAQGTGAGRSDPDVSILWV